MAATLLLLGVSATSASAQRPGVDSTATAVPRVFLDCEDCDGDYVRRQVEFVDYVNDPHVANVHLFITSSDTGGGGEQYSVNFLGRERFDGISFRLGYHALPAESDAAVQAGLTRIIRLGLVPFLSQTAAEAEVEVERRREPGAGRSARDPWNAWVFAVEGGGRLEAEQRKKEYTFTGQLEAKRVTELWRFETSLEASREQENVELEEDDEPARLVRSASRALSWDGRLVRGFGQHWAVGLSGDVYSDTRENTELGVRVSPAVEYNVLPYRESEQRELTFAYRIGPRYFRYQEETIYGRLREARFEEAVELRLALKRPWGTVETSLEGSHYLADARKHRVEFQNDLSLRLLRGLALDIELEGALVHDQLYIEAGGASPEDILTERKELLTNYETRVEVGLSYTFGSIFSSVVNTRL